MQRDRVLLYLTVVLFLSTPVGCGRQNPCTDAPEETTTPNPPVAQVVAGTRHHRPLHVAKVEWTYSGVVAALGLDWIELAAGWRGSVETDRTGRQTVRANGDTKMPRRLSTAGTVPGGDPGGDGDDFTYWLSDLKVGDVVFIRTHESNGDEWTTEIDIRRRPGGTIPPINGESANPPKYHLWNQAEQDWEEKGIPIPRKYLDPQGRAPWTNPPYPPVAPMPRSIRAEQ